MKFVFVLFLFSVLPLKALANCNDVNLFEQENSIIKKAIDFSKRRKSICDYKNYFNILTLYSVIEKGFQEDKVDITCEPGVELLNLPELRQTGLSTLAILSKLTNECDHQIDLKKTKLESAWPSFIPLPDFIVKSHLQSHFREQNTPANLWLCDNLISNPNADSLDWKRSAKKDCSLNRLTMVGTRRSFKTKNCEYLLHDPTRTNIEQWGDNWSCFCEYGGKYKDNCTKTDIAENPSLTVLACWIPEDLLAKNLKEFSWLETKDNPYAID